MPALKEIKQAIDESVERLRVDLGRQIDGGDALTRAELRQEIAVKVEFADIRALLQASHGDLDRRVTRLEKGR